MRTTTGRAMTATSRRRKKRARSDDVKGKWRTTPIGLKHQMDPLMLGIAAAEFVPADPEMWIELANANDMVFGVYQNRLLINEKTGLNLATSQCLAGWLIGTPGGQDAVRDLLIARGLLRFPINRC